MSIYNYEPVGIVEAAAVTALSADPAELTQRLISGDSAITTISRFPVKDNSVGFAACIDDLADEPDQTRLDGLLDRLLFRLSRIGPDTELITATTKAGIDALEKISRNFPASQQSLIPGYLSQITAEKTGLNSGFTISAACASSTIAISRAASMIALGRRDSVLVVCADIISDFVFSGFSALKALAIGTSKPFDEHRNGLSLGEGAAALLLMSARRAKLENRRFLGIIKGWGASNDAAHITAPAKDASGLIRAIRQALSFAGVSPQQIAAVSAHGTGTVYNDAMELKAVQAVFGQRKLPVYSIKGAIGHTLGSAGGIETIQAFETLNIGIVPPTAGMLKPAAGATDYVSSKPVKIDGDYILKINSGFSGINAALIIQRQGSSL